MGCRSGLELAYTIAERIRTRSRQADTEKDRDEVCFGICSCRNIEFRSWFSVLERVDHESSHLRLLRHGYILRVVREMAHCSSVSGIALLEPYRPPGTRGGAQDRWILEGVIEAIESTTLFAVQETIARDAHVPIFEYVRVVVFGSHVSTAALI
jgi:hypothetical protein